MLNLSNILSIAGQKIVDELSTNIREQKQLDGNMIAPVALSTMMARVKKGMVSITRLLFTGYFWQNAFKYIVSGNRLTIFGNPTLYPGSNVTYADIIAYNDRDDSETNQNVMSGNRPKIFPRNEIDLLKMKCIPEIKRDFEIEALRQIESDLGVQPKITITIG